MLDDGARCTLDRFLDELSTWTARINLTAVPREQAWERHVAESMLLLEVASPSPGARLCDLGSGGGLPGIPVAVARPDLHLVLCDSDRRRCAFLIHVTALLRLSNVTVLDARAEALGRGGATREAFDGVISRALAPPAVLCELALPLLRLGGRLDALVGDAAGAAAEAENAARFCGGGTPHAAAPGVLTVAKVATTPDRYPRREGVPGRRPLR